VRRTRELPAVRARACRAPTGVGDTHHFLGPPGNDFTPKSWSIQKAGLPRIVGTAIDFIELVMQHEKVRYRLAGNKLRRLKTNIASARRDLKALGATYKVYGNVQN
jgi:hypothetical protein